MSDNHNELRGAIVEEVCRVFGLPAEAVESGATPDTVEGWDSEKHVELVIALENRFGCMFEPEEIAELTSLPQMEEVIRRHG